ncbi:hypothetical protein ACQE3E_15690 [Methylomonas sp. MED-D]|uniref:hypothetical protein n=1 Tax=unclassified Methylomonas TaxID=2608980 RepID=UPI003CFFBDC1
MSLVALLAAREKLQNDAALTAFFQTRYNKPARHIIGYKSPQNINDCPVVCYVPVLYTRATQVGGWHQERPSIVVGLLEAGQDGDVFDGPAQLAEVENLIFDCLESGALGARSVYLGEGRSVASSIRHPIYEAELKMLLGWR